MAFKITPSLVISYTDNLKLTSEYRVTLNKLLFKVQSILKLCCDNNIRTIPDYILCIYQWLKDSNNILYTKEVKEFLVLTFQKKHLVTQYFNREVKHSIRSKAVLTKFKELSYNLGLLL